MSHVSGRTQSVEKRPATLPGDSIRESAKEGSKRGSEKSLGGSAQEELQQSRIVREKEGAGLLEGAGGPQIKEGKNYQPGRFRRPDASG